MLLLPFAVAIVSSGESCIVPEEGSEKDRHAQQLLFVCLHGANNTNDAAIRTTTGCFLIT